MTATSTREHLPDERQSTTRPLKLTYVHEPEVVDAAVRAVADLRHAYAQMLRPGWNDAKVASLARGLIGPAIAALEASQAPEVRTMKIYATAGMYADGRPGELWLKADKQGSFVSGLFDALAIAVSVALQHGAPIATIARKMAHQSFAPYGKSNVPEIPRVTSPVDLVGRWLMLKFAPQCMHTEEVQPDAFEESPTP